MELSLYSPTCLYGVHRDNFMFFYPQMCNCPLHTKNSSLQVHRSSNSQKLSRVLYDTVRSTSLARIHHKPVESSPHTNKHVH